MKSREERRAAKNARRERERAEEARRGVRTVGVYVGGTAQVDALILHEQYKLHFGLEGLRISSEDAGVVLDLQWTEVTDVLVEDASSERQQTRVEKHRYGLFGGAFRRMPVAVSETSRIAGVSMTVNSEARQLVFELGWGKDSLEEVLSASRHLWGSRPGGGSKSAAEGQAAQEAEERSVPDAESDEEMTRASALTSLPSGDVFDQIRKLGKLRDAGLLTQEEFESKKTELLSRL